MRHVFANTAVNYTTVSPTFTLTRHPTGVLPLSIVVKRHFTVMPTNYDKYSLYSQTFHM